ncbi:hypothetical protein AAE478_006031 [Parahypoxylon ruwenzoriense]
MCKIHRDFIVCRTCNSVTMHSEVREYCDEGVDEFGNRNLHSCWSFRRHPFMPHITILQPEDSYQCLNCITENPMPEEVSRANLRVLRQFILSTPDAPATAGRPRGARRVRRANTSVGDNTGDHTGDTTSDSSNDSAGDNPDELVMGNNFEGLDLNGMGTTMPRENMPIPPPAGYVDGESPIVGFMRNFAQLRVQHEALTAADNAQYEDSVGGGEARDVRAPPPSVNDETPDGTRNDNRLGLQMDLGGDGLFDEVTRLLDQSMNDVISDILRDL